MALGPDVGREKRQQSAKAAEARIDKAIRDSTGDRVTIATSLLDMNYQTWEQVLRPKYKQAGWRKAEWVSDQRDGDFIDLEA